MIGSACNTAGDLILKHEELLAEIETARVNDLFMSPENYAAVRRTKGVYHHTACPVVNGEITTAAKWAFLMEAPERLAECCSTSLTIGNGRTCNDLPLGRWVEANHSLLRYKNLPPLSVDESFQQLFGRLLALSEVYSVMESTLSPGGPALKELGAPSRRVHFPPLFAELANLILPKYEAEVLALFDASTPDFFEWSRKGDQAVACKVRRTSNLMEGIPALQPAFGPVITPERRIRLLLLESYVYSLPTLPSGWNIFPRDLMAMVLNENGGQYDAHFITSVVSVPASITADIFAEALILAEDLEAERDFDGQIIRSPLEIACELMNAI